MVFGSVWRIMTTLLHGNAMAKTKTRKATGIGVSLDAKKKFVLFFCVDLVGDDRHRGNLWLQRCPSPVALQTTPLFLKCPRPSGNRYQPAGTREHSYAWSSLVRYKKEQKGRVCEGGRFLGAISLDWHHADEKYEQQTLVS